MSTCLFLQAHRRGKDKMRCVYCMFAQKCGWAHVDYDHQVTSHVVVSLVCSALNLNAECPKGHAPQCSECCGKNEYRNRAKGILHCVFKWMDKTVCMLCNSGAVQDQSICTSVIIWYSHNWWNVSGKACAQHWMCHSNLLATDKLATSSQKWNRRCRFPSLPTCHSTKNRYPECCTATQD